LFDALFHILPLGTEMDKVEATHARGVSGAPSGNATWHTEAQHLMREMVAAQPVLVQISAAKRLRDQAERRAREAGLEEVATEHVQSAGRELGMGVTA
jgi:chlorophyllide a reductase subunit Z